MHQPMLLLFSSCSSCSLSIFLLLSFFFLASPSSSEPIVTIDQLTLKVSPSSSADVSSSSLTKCQSDYLAALVHRCMMVKPTGGTNAGGGGGEARICFADEVGLENVHGLIGHISEMCCLLRCQAKTLERLCCRNTQHGRCRKANCLPIRGHEVLWSGSVEQDDRQSWRETVEE